MGTKFTEVYDSFLGKTTDDMYVELTPEDTVKDLRRMLINTLADFEFPRKNLFDYKIEQEIKPEDQLDENDFCIGLLWEDIGEDSDMVPDVVVENSFFAEDLTAEEINILAINMMIAWVQRQVTSIEETRMKYSGSDFKFTSQANHLQKLITLLHECQRQSLHMQRLYKRRKVGPSGVYQSNWSALRDINTLND